MAKHFDELSILKSKIQSRKVTQSNPQALIIKDNDNTLFKSQQDLLNIIIHCGDLGTQTRDFETALSWTYLVQEEFFIQGDEERRLGFPVTNLCDREKLDVSKSQIGFMTFLV